MSTIPAYDPAATPLSGTDQFYLEQGSDADRGKRATIQMVMDKVTASMEPRISGIEGDVSTLESTTAGNTSDISKLKTVAQVRSGALNGIIPNGASYAASIGSVTLVPGKWALSGFTYTRTSADSGSIPANTLCTVSSHMNTTGTGTEDLTNFPNIGVGYITTGSFSVAAGAPISTTNGEFIYDVVAETTVYLVAVIVSPGTSIKWDAFGAIVARRIW